MASNFPPTPLTHAGPMPANPPLAPQERVLVTGGAGFIGRHLVARLLERGAPVRVLDALVESVHGPDPVLPGELTGAEFLRGDVRDAALLDRAVEGCGLVYHLAAETGTGESMYRTHRYVDVNVGGTAQLCDAIGRAAVRPRRLVLASSRAIYGEGPYLDEQGGVCYPPPRSEAALARADWDPRGPHGEVLRPAPMGPACRPGPTSVYGETKRAQEELIRLMMPVLEVESTTLRLQNVYGPGQSTRNPYTGILSIFSVLLLQGDTVRVFEDGLESRDFVFVDDVVEAFLRAGAGDGGGAEPVVDVGTGQRTTVLEVARVLALQLGRPADALQITGEYRLGDVRHAFADTSELQRQFGLTPRVSFDEGVSRLTDWIRGVERPRSRLGEALAEMSALGLLGNATGPSS